MYVIRKFALFKTCPVEEKSGYPVYYQLLPLYAYITLILVFLKAI
jgi:hypothetical protein